MKLPDSIPLTSLRLHRYTKAPERTLRLGRYLLWALIGLGPAMAFVPWQQTVSGAGRVVALAPNERFQVVQAPVSGRIVRWHVIEGSRVGPGDRIADMADIDPDYLDRLEERLAADRERVRAAESRLTAYREQVDSYEQARSMKVRAARMKVEMARQKLAVAEQKAKVAETAVATARQNLTRTSKLETHGISSARQLELAELDAAKAEADRNLSQAEVLEAQSAVAAAEAEVTRVDAEGEAKVATAQAESEKASAEAAYARGDVVKLESERARQLAQAIVAPVGGTVVRVEGNLGGGGVVKAGEHLVSIVPDTTSRAVEVFVDGNDAPLVERGRRVRLQFEGWPALQFVGWPSVAVGTFGGVVSFVDPAATDELGRVRVLVLPDGRDAPWPAAELLRQQGRAMGWVLLDSVPLGWELWRRLNGFPASVAKNSPASSARTSSPAKVGAEQGDGK